MDLREVVEDSHGDSGMAEAADDAGGGGILTAPVAVAESAESTAAKFSPGSAMPTAPSSRAGSGAGSVSLRPFGLPPSDAGLGRRVSILEAKLAELAACQEQTAKDSSARFDNLEQALGGLADYNAPANSKKRSLEAVVCQLVQSQTEI